MATLRNGWHLPGPPWQHLPGAPPWQHLPGTSLGAAPPWAQSAGGPSSTLRTYQLWLIADGAPISAGIFDVESDGSAMLLVEEIERPEDIQLWAVTIEPAGGVPQPTGAMVLKG